MVIAGGVIAVVAILFFSIFALRSVFSSNEKGSPDGEGKRPPFGREMEEGRKIPVSVVEVEPGGIKDTLFYTAELQAEDEVEVYSVAAGKVIRYNFDEGEPIRKGEILVTLERQEIYDEYLPLNVRAPISGIVARNYLDSGDLATTQTPLSLIVGSKKIKAIVNVPGMERGLIAVGMKAELVVTEVPERVFIGVVKEISPILDPTTRTTRVEVLFENEDASLVSGMFGDIELIIEEKTDVITLPYRALLFESGGRKDPSCFVVEGDRAVKRSLSLGIMTEEQAEVTSGVEPGDRVIVGGKENIREGSVVVVTDML
jgi:multidrug efflux pump subunit AcrA (membrane-fusion protein)